MGFKTEIPKIKISWKPVSVPGQPSVSAIGPVVMLYEAELIEAGKMGTLSRGMVRVLALSGVNDTGYKARPILRPVSSGPRLAKNSLNDNLSTKKKLANYGRRTMFSGEESSDSRRMELGSRLMVGPCCMKLGGVIRTDSEILRAWECRKSGTWRRRK